MRKSLIVGVLLACATVLAIPVSAEARNRVYHPTLGRFLQRDPLGRSAATPLARDLSSPEYTKRDTTDQYRDGMDLYQYARSNPLILKDAMGLECGVTVRRIDIPKQDNSPLARGLGHTWLDYPGGSMGFWPKGDPDLTGLGTAESDMRSPDPHADDKADREWTTSRLSGWWILRFVLTDGKAKGRDCRCAACDEIIDCMQERGRYFERTRRWSALNFDCRTFVEAVANSCCLTIDGYWTW